MGLAHLRILKVGGDDMHAALAFLREYPGLRPRDAVHANAGSFTIACDDQDLDQIREIERWPL